MSRSSSRPPIANVVKVLRGLQLESLSRSLPDLETVRPTPTRVTVSALPASGTMTAPDTPDAVASARAEAERAGYQQGLAAGRLEAKAELQRERDALAAKAAEQETARQETLRAALGSLEGALKGLGEAHVRHRQQLSAQSVGLAFEALCLMLGRRETHREHLLQLIDAGLDRWTGGSIPLARVSPADAALLREIGTDDASIALLARVVLEGDSAVPVGGCLLEDEDGGLDIGMDTQLQALRAVWLEALARQTSAPAPEAGA